VAEDSDQGQKTEDPTQKRLDEAIERGDVAKSQEVNTWFVIGGATLVLSSFSGTIGDGLKATLAGLFANAHRIPTDGHGLVALVHSIGLTLIAALGVPLLLLMVAAFAGNVIQHRFVWSAEAVSPKLNKISPLAGLQRLFSKQALANFIKGLIKLGLIGTVMVAVLWPERHRLDALVRIDPDALIGITRSLSLSLLGTVVAILAMVAAGDYFFQYRQWFERQKMSLHEMKEEFKQTEGDPHVKGRLRQLRMARVRKRMMAAVPTASVVVTNPTHFAVALKYERGMPAPICVAKGMDLIALKIREIAKENGVPVIENPPLARALHATVDIDSEIPVEHYKAVAELIGYVMKLRRGFARH
jgi:flagellar biosynthetic protein FlhB